jgi:hypothetical protein
VVAFLLTIAIFATWTVIGWPLVSLLIGGRNLLRNGLLAPLAGLATVSSAIFEANRFGLPVAHCGPPLTLLLVALAAAAIWRYRFPFPGRRLIPFVAALAAALVLVAYPMFLHGFNWVSYCNDDMANYVQGARGFLAHGYLDSYDSRQIVEYRDLALTQWLPVTLLGIRCGSELVLAWVMSMTGLAGHGVFMPVIVALHLVLISSTAALVLRGRHYRRAGLAAAAWMAVSSLVVLATVYQLIAQVFGLALVAGAAALLLTPVPALTPAALLRRAALPGLFAGTLGFVYPEAWPFLALSLVLAHTVALVRGRQQALRLFTFLASAGLLVLLLWNTYAESVPAYLLRQARTGLRGAVVANMLFPYYLVPSGLATFWGFLPISRSLAAPLLDVAIAAGALLLLCAVLTVIRQMWRGEPAAAVTLVMLTLTLALVRNRSDFGLYKMAMYIQPFLIAAVAPAWIGTPRRRFAHLLPVAVVALAGFPAHLYYVGVSAGLPGVQSSFVEIPDASSRGISRRLRDFARAPHRDTVVSDTSNIVLAKFEATYLTPSRQQYPARDFFTHGNLDVERISRWYADIVKPGYADRARAVLVRWNDGIVRETFDMRDGRTNSFDTIPGRDGTGRSYSLLASGPRLSALNRRHGGRLEEAPLFRVVPSEQVHNHLIQMDSYLGRNYYLSTQARSEGRIAMFQLEPDLYYPGRTMSGLGSVIVFEVLNPTPDLRLLIDFTASLQSDGRNRIPWANAIGSVRVPFATVGRGSARLVSGPLTPQTIAGRHYVSIDMGTSGQLFPQPRAGLMRWFGTGIALDSRRLTGFVRDISAISAEEYAAMEVPAQASSFPAALAAPGLEYSGIYEDGWVGEESRLWLRQPLRSGPLRIRVEVPGIGRGATRMRVLVDGAEVAATAPRPGVNLVEAALAPAAARRQIDLRFDGAISLQAPDLRRVSARLDYVGFEEIAAQPEDIVLAPITLGEHWYATESDRGVRFRWAADDARFAIVSAAPGPGELLIDAEPGPGLGGKPARFRLTRGDGPAQTLSSISGRQTLRVPLRLSPGPNYFSLHVNGGSAVIQGDPRTLNFRVFALTWSPSR